MKIVYQGGPLEVTSRDILDQRFNTWRYGEVRDVPDDLMVNCLVYGGEDGQTEARNAVEAILNHGPAFVNAETGKNPLHVCARCGEKTLAHGFRPVLDRPYVEYLDAKGDPLCPPCFLAEHPEYVAHHRELGVSKAFEAALADRQRRAAQPAVRPSVSAPPVVRDEEKE